MSETVLCQHCGEPIRGYAIRVSYGNIGPSGRFAATRHHADEKSDFFHGTCRAGVAIRG